MMANDAIPKPLAPLKWMYMLATVTAVICVAEFWVGKHAHSLALLGDCGHVLLDLCSYVAAIMCELLKTVARGNRRTVAAIDLFICLFIIITVASGSAYVLEAAMHRLTGLAHDHKPGDHGENEAAERAAGLEHGWQDIFVAHPAGTADHADADGRLMFAFALSSMIVNAGLGLTGYYYVKNAHGGWWEWVHAVLHPGCTAQGCTEVHDVEGGKRQKMETPINLNVTIMWIHVSCDAVKDLVLLCVSFLMMEKYVGSKAADAAASLVVVCMVILGSVWICPAVWIRLKQVFWNEELEDDNDETKSLLSTGRKNRDRSKRSNDIAPMLKQQRRKRLCDWTNDCTDPYCTDPHVESE